MKRKIFIGSSFEGLKVAETIKEQINSNLGEWVDCEIWKTGEVFSLNKGTLECLTKASRKYDYGILVASNDDILIKRKNKSISMRDNVLFEIGLFLGSLGLNRAFLLIHKDIKLPSDFNGTTTVCYNDVDVEEAIDCIIKKIEETKESFNLKPMPSAALAMGYFDNFIEPFFKKRLLKSDKAILNILIPQNINNIKSTIVKYKLNNKSIKTFGGRPIAYRYLKNINYYWDIPTSLSTLKELIDFFIHSQEIGIDKEKEEWILHELRNFKGTLEMLIKKHNIFKNKIKVKYM